MFFARRNKNEYERNSKQYIAQKFQFLRQRGYILEYYHRNGEELFSYSNGHCTIDVINEPHYIDVLIRYGRSFPYEHEHNIREVLSPEIDNEIRLLAPIQIIDYFSSIVFQNIEEIEKFHA